MFLCGRDFGFRAWFAVVSEKSVSASEAGHSCIFGAQELSVVRHPHPESCTERRRLRMVKGIFWVWSWCCGSAMVENQSRHSVLSHLPNNAPKFAYAVVKDQHEEQMQATKRPLADRYNPSVYSYN